MFRYEKMRYNGKYIVLAQALRKNMTKEERHLWFDFLHDYPMRFLRQKVIGNYIVDFYCAKAKLVIELDGSQHFDDENKMRDNERDEFLSTIGITVMRICNSEINENFRGVCEYIENTVNNLTQTNKSQGTAYEE